jgi:hypothetical protein
MIFFRKVRNSHYFYFQVNSKIVRFILITISRLYVIDYQIWIINQAIVNFNRNLNFILLNIRPIVAFDKIVINTFFNQKEINEAQRKSSQKK